jgi:hypothetical protein
VNLKTTFDAVDRDFDNLLELVESEMAALEFRFTAEQPGLLLHQPANHWDERFEELNSMVDEAERRVEKGRE